MINTNTLLKELKDAEEDLLRKAYWMARKKSSGKYKAEKLARMGHPYAARRHMAGTINSLVPYGDPSIINVQSGNFANSWHTSKPTFSGNTITSSLYNSVAYADELAEGIPGLTIARPVIPSMIRNLEFWRNRYLSKAIVRAIEASRP